MASMPQSREIEKQIGLKKQDPTICCLQETHLTEKKTNTGLESKGGKKFSKQMDPINKQEKLYSYLTK
jgi:hypothetical protein